MSFKKNAHDRFTFLNQSTCMTQNLFLLIILLSFCLESIAQDNNTIDVQVPSSPTASELGNYGQFEVGKSTGSVNINIPITSIQEGGISIPVSIGYQSSGLKVEQRRSSVGLGWVLNVGGVISRTMYGRCDDLDKGFLSNSMSIPNRNIVEAELRTSGRKVSRYNWLNNTLNNEVDYTPDQFSFNFGNYGGVFFFGNDAEVQYSENGGSQLNFEPVFDYITEEGFPISSGAIIVGWRVKDSNGFVYTFSDYEFTRSHTKEGWEQKYISAWYLSSVKNELNGTIAYFNYKDDSNSYSYENENISYNYRKNDTGGEYDFTWVSGPSRSPSWVEHTNVKFIDRITLGNQRIDFAYETGSHGYEVVTSISMYSGDLTQDVDFIHSYFTSECSDSESCFRLRLDAIQEQLGADIKEHRFDYYNGTLPSRKSYSQDHWGYYNGANNANLVPKYVFYVRELGGYANRKVSESFTKLGMLKSITYPTKGSSHFSYEQNTFSDFTTADDLNNNESSARKEVTGEGRSTEVCRAIDLVAGTPHLNSTYSIELDYGVQFNGLDGLPEAGRYPHFQIADSEDFDDYIYDHKIIGSASDNFSLDHNKVYNFRLCATGDDVIAAVKIKVIEVDHSKIGLPIAREIGGLRIKSITNYEPISHSSEKTYFDYGYGGYKIWRDPSYTQFSTITSCNEALGREFARNLTISGNSIWGLGPSSLPVAYETVIEFKEDESLPRGKIETKYYRIEDDQNPFMPQLSNNFLRSKIISEKYFTKDNLLIKSEEFSYSVKNTGVAIGFGINRSVNGPICTDASAYTSDFQYDNFRMHSTLVQLTDKVVRTYSDGTFDGLIKPDNSLTDSIHYIFDDNLFHRNLTSISKVDSKENIESTHFSYPMDWVASPINCYENYDENLKECQIGALDYTVELGEVQQIWNSAHAQWMYCHLTTSRDITNNCNGSLECQDRKTKDADCLGEFNAELIEKGYFADLENASNDFIGCQKSAFLEYKICKENQINALFDNYTDDLITEENAIAILNIKGIQSAPVEVTQKYNGIEVSKTYNKFNVWMPDGNEIPLISSLFKSFNSGDLSLQVSINEYDDKNNPVEVVTKDGIVKTYIWGYNQRYLIAEIINADVVKVKEILASNYQLLQGNTLTENQIIAYLKNLSESASMKNAQVTIYTYKDGMGLSKKVDPNGVIERYIYNSSGRLIEVRDDDDNLLQSYDYNYAN